MAKSSRTDTNRSYEAELDRELSDVLIAISVITRQLARKITVKNMSKEDKKDAETLRTNWRGRQHEI